MKSLNQTCLTGKIMGEPEVRYFGSGTAILKFRFCFWTSKKDGDTWKETGNFIDVIQWKPSENFTKLLKDRTPLAISGNLEMDEWQDKNSGQKRSKIQLVARDICFFSAPKDAASQDSLAPVDEYKSEQGTIPLADGDSTPF